MLKMPPSEKETKDYSLEQEIQDTKKFSKFIEGLSNAQFAILFSLVLGEYSMSNLSDALDLTVDKQLKEELSDLWTFRSSHGLGV